MLTDEAGSSAAMRVARLAALAPGLAALGGWIALSQAASRGELRAYPAAEAFEDLLPESIAWRQKEQFSDGVGYGWIDAVKEFTAERVSDAEMARAAGRFPFNTPASKEAYWFRTVFERHFPLASAERTVPGGPTVACSTPEAVLWDRALQEMNDPSGRAMRNVHKDSY